MEKFLDQGGHVEEIPRGRSAAGPMGPPPLMTNRLFNEPRAERTLVPEVIAAIEERRNQRLKRKPAAKRSRLPKPRRKTIYDDFGEPVRKVWIEE